MAGGESGTERNGHGRGVDVTARAGVSLERHTDALTLTNAARAPVHAQVDVLQSFLAELETKAARYREVASDLRVDVPGGTLPAVRVHTSG